MAARSKQEASPRTCASECECELEARLDEIERRLSALEGASAETIADLAWQAAAPSPADQTRAVEDRLARLLEVLATHRRATAAAKALGDSHGAGAETRRFGRY